MKTLQKSAPTKTVVCGIDEAGRGALAGPVVAAACILPDRKKFPVMIDDSKAMSSQEREISYEWLIKNCIHGIGFIEADIIDEIGIMAATEQAMQMAVATVAKFQRDLYLLVDGRDKFWFDYPHSSIVGGDSLEACISAASIIAKVTRDRRMMDLALDFPAYGFEKHKGYGSPAHFTAIREHGVSPKHRRTFLRSV